MGDQRDLESRIRVLEDIEAIKRLQHKYWRCMSTRQWDEVADCFIENGELDMGPDRKFTGIDEIRAFFRSLGPRMRLNVPQGHSPEIEITGETAATGIWMVDVCNVPTTSNASRAAALYRDNYTKVNGEWKIKNKTSTFLYTQAVQLLEVKDLT